MTGSQCVWTSEIPDQAAALLPRHCAEPVRTFAIITSQRRWFKSGWDVGWRQSALDEVIDGSVSGVTTGRLAAAETVCPWRADGLPADRLHVCETQTGAPRRSAMAMRRDVSSSLVPTEEHGTAWRKSPAWSDAAARRRASPTWVGAADWK